MPRCRVLFLFAALLAASFPAVAQQVQFIHAAPYSEVRFVDVYRDGVLWVEGLEYAKSTLTEDWPRRATLEVRPAAASRSEPAALRLTVSLREEETIALVLAGDPGGQGSDGAFRIERISGHHVMSSQPPLNEYRQMWLVPETAAYAEIRDYMHFDVDANVWEAFAGPDIWRYGDLAPDYMPVAPFRFEIDWRTYPDSGVVGQWVSDFSGVFGKAFLGVSTAVPDWVPPEAGLKWFEIGTFGDGSFTEFQPNEVPLQIVNNSPYTGGERLTVRVTWLDTRGPTTAPLLDQVLAFRESTPVIWIPSGVYVSHPRPTAPEVVLEVLDASGESLLYQERRRFVFGERLLATIDGDPLRREGGAPFALNVSRGWRASPPSEETVSVIYASGVADLNATTIRGSRMGVDWLGPVIRGGFQVTDGFPVRGDTLQLLRSGSMGEALELARFPLPGQDVLDAATGASPQGPWVVPPGLSLVSSGFARSNSLAASGTDLALLSVPASGGMLTPLTKLAPRGVWTYWWFWVAVIAVSAVVVTGVNQARMMRLRARTRELDAIVTERTLELRTEKARTERQAQALAELDKAKNRFFANISHEFRTPLTLILGLVQDGLDKATGQRVVLRHRNAHVIRRSGYRLLRLVNQLLDLAKLESGEMKLEPRPLDVAAFVRQVCSALVPQAERGGLEFQTDVPAEVVIVDFDEDALEKVLTNLIFNAIKFTPRGGKILVSLDTEDGATISVRDTGPGISAEDQRRIFERFQQGDTDVSRSGGGSGIGLALARELTDLHGGELLLDSRRGFGSTFSVRLPLSSAASPEELVTPAHHALEGLEEETPVAQKEAEADDARGASVLVVEDNAAVRDFLCGHLSERYSVLQADDGVAALEILQTREVDLILTDLMMPRMDGNELCRRIKADPALSDLPVVMLTAKAGTQDVVAGLKCGADAYISKPFDMQSLELRVANLIATRRALRHRYQRELVLKPSNVVVESDDERLLQHVLEVIEEHLGDGYFSIDWLADEVALSRRHLERQVVRIAELTPAQLVRQLRMDRARQLLEGHVGSVSEVAQAVGFRSSSHFARVFRAYFGESPTDRRAALSGDGDSLPV